ncbi:MAG: hypothetical protein JRH16_02440 [Deltaproteobacteria bacterium]|nr:hypothetical protein [Deltaproteobacteria bacterium]MBW2360592.1 hypothetical protein [Deltaproteobacteria bacterium]
MSGILVDVKRAGEVACVLLLLLGAPSCATTQRVSLDCVPHEVSVFVDGRELRAGTSDVALATDEPHTVFFRGGGYAPRLVVLDSVDGENGTQLSPPDVCSHTAFVPMRPDVEMHIDTSVSEGPPAD